MTPPTPPTTTRARSWSRRCAGHELWHVCQSAWLVQASGSERELCCLERLYSQCNAVVLVWAGQAMATAAAAAAVAATAAVAVCMHTAGLSLPGCSSRTRSRSCSGCATPSKHGALRWLGGKATVHSSCTPATAASACTLHRWSLTIGSRLRCPSPAGFVSRVAQDGQQRDQGQDGHHECAQGD